MAKKQKRGGSQKGFAGLEAGLKRLGVVAKDLEKVRTNLRKFLDQAEKNRGSHISIIPRGKSRPR
jgi:hypothetical protein